MPSRGWLDYRRAFGKSATLWRLWKRRKRPRIGRTEATRKRRMMWWWGSKKRAEHARARQHREQGRQHADILMAGLHDRLFSECTSDPSLAAFAALRLAEVLATFEPHFLWGFFSEYSLTEDFPTKGDDRIKLHLIDWFVHSRNHSPDSAVAAANLAGRQQASGDKVSETISVLGAQSFREGGDGALVTVMRAFASQPNSKLTH